MWSKPCTLVIFGAVALVTFHLIATVSSAETYEASCQVGVTADNKTLDTCDTRKFLQCKEGRCLCEDSKNQIWASRSRSSSSPGQISVVLSRTKRAKGSKGKPKGSSGGRTKIAAGVAAGAGAGYLASSVVNSGVPHITAGKVNSFLNRPTSTSAPSTASGSNSGRRSYGCYGRVGAQCVLDNAGDVVLSIKGQSTTSTTTTTTTTTEATTSSSSTISTTEGSTSSSSSSTTPSTVTEGQVDNSTTSTPDATSSTAQSLAETSSTPSSTTEAAASTTTTTTTTAVPSTSSTSTVSPLTLETLRLPKCVENAECKVPEVKIVDGKVVSGGDSTDPRIGVCACAAGYRANSQDICVKL